MLASEDESGLDFSYLQELSSLGKGTSTTEPKGQSSKKEVRSLPSKDAVQAVLERKRKAEQEKAEAFRKDREKLLELRSQDRKANKRVKAMITRTKGFSKAVVDDAKDLTTARGEQQCDEDDYGYESTMSQQIFDKLTTQYSEMPEDERLKFKKVKVDNINDVKSRVLNSLKKQEEEEQGPRKRKRKHATSEQDDFINDGDPYDKSSGGSSRESDKKDKSKHEHRLPVNLNLTNYQTKDNENFKYDYDKKKREEKEKRDKELEKEERRKKRMKLANQPPALGFAELMKLAATKAKETDIKKGEDLAKEQIKEREALLKKKLSDRPLTAQEKAQQEEERLRKLRRQGKLPNLPIEKLKELKEQQMNKKEGKSDPPKEEGKSHKESNGTEASSVQKKEQSSDKNSKKIEQPKPEAKIRDRSKYFAVPGAPKPATAPAQSSSSSLSSASKSSIAQSSKLPNGKTLKPSDSKALKPPGAKSKPYDSSSMYKTPDSKARLHKGESSGSKMPKPYEPSKSIPSKGRQFPPADLKPLKKPSGGRFGRVDSEDEDSEYDSEMDDFIDDGEDELDYSSEIKKMFGYDKSRFKDEPEDVDDMEVGFGQVEKEEMRSAKLGLLEDLEDMKQEEEEKKRKLLKKKLALKGR